MNSIQRIALCFTLLSISAIVHAENDSVCAHGSSRNPDQGMQLAQREAQQKLHAALTSQSDHAIAASTMCNSKDCTRQLQEYMYALVDTRSNQARTQESYAHPDKKVFWLTLCSNPVSVGNFVFSPPASQPTTATTTKTETTVTSKSTVAVSPTLNSGQAFETSKTSCLIASDHAQLTLAAQKRLLVQRSKSEAVKELFGEFLYSKEHLVNNRLVDSQFSSQTMGFIRVRGNPKFYQGNSLGEICTDLTAYITAADLEKLKPQPVTINNFCVNSQHLQVSEIKVQANYAAYAAIVKQFRPQSHISGKEAQKFIHAYQTNNATFDLEQSKYCFDVQASVVVAELNMVPEDQNIIGYIPKANDMAADNFKYNLLAHWSFDDCSAKDFSNNGRTLNNSFQCVDGRKGKAAHIRTDQFLRPPYIDFTHYNEFTISFWVKENSMSHKDGTGYVFFGDHSRGGWVGVANFWGKIHFNVGESSHPKGAGIIAHNSNQYRGRFHHFVLSYKNGMSKAYIDGNFVARSNQRLALPSKRHRAGIGNHYWNNGRNSAERLDAVFDEIIILNKQVSQSEVDMLYFGDY